MRNEIEGMPKIMLKPCYRKEVVAVDKKYFRPTEVELLIGDPTKSKTKLGWNPKYDLKALVNDMMTPDLEHCKKEKLLKAFGYVINNQFE